MEQQPRR